MCSSKAEWVSVSAWTGLTIETLIMTPFALLFLLFFDQSTVSLWDRGISIVLLLMGAGVITAIPLLLFAAGAKRISFTLVGFLQYVAPTIMLILGLFLFHEPFSLPQLLSFILIWIALIIFLLSRSWELLRKRKLNSKPEFQKM